MQRDFKCQFDVLLKYMKYFGSALKSINEGDDFDVTVHCDAKIFQWLLLYIEKEERKTHPRCRFFEIENERISADYRAEKPIIKVDNIISILISADYLRIPRLVDDCLDFFVANMNAILDLKIDLSCI